MSAFHGANTRILAGKQETVAGTAATITAAEVFARAYNVDIQPDFPMDEAGMRPAIGAGAAEGQAYPTTKTFKLTFDMDFIPAATDATEPDIFKLCNGCGCYNVASSTTGRIMYRRAAYSDQSWTFVVQDTELGGGSPVTSGIGIAGAMGNVVFKGAMNRVLTASFTFTGKMVAALTVDGTLLVSSGITALKPAQAFTDSSMTVHVAALVSEWEFDLGNEVSPIWSSADASGVLHYAVTNSKPRFKCNPLAQKYATKNWITSISTVPTYSANQPLYGGIAMETAAAGRFSLKIFDAQPLQGGIKAREGFRSWDLNMACLMNGVPGALIDASPRTLEDTFYWLQGTLA